MGFFIKEETKELINSLLTDDNWVQTQYTLRNRRTGAEICYFKNDIVYKMNVYLDPKTDEILEKDKNE